MSIGLGVGHPHALDELALLADLGQQLLDLRAAAVHDHRLQADQLEQHHVAREALLELLVGHRVAAVLHHDDLAVEAADVGHRLGQDRGLLGGGDPDGLFGGSFAHGGPRTGAARPGG